MRNRNSPPAILLLFLALLTLASCNEDPQVIYPEVDPFDQLVAAQNVTVKLQNGNPELSVSGYGDLSAVQLSVSDGILTIALPNPGSAQNVVVEISHNDMVSVSSTQNSRVSLSSDFSTSSRTLRVSAFNNSAVYSYHKIAVDTLDLRLMDDSFVGFRQVEASRNLLSMGGGSLCFLEGTTADQFIELSDGCYYNLEEVDSGWGFSGPLQADSTWVTARNGATAWVQANAYLNATGTTGSMIYYKGDPVTIEQNMTTGAELIQKNQ